MITLYKYLSLANTEQWKNRKQLIGERCLYFSDASRFNDPLDCNVSAWEAAKSLLRPARMFCLSMENRDDNLMFAHYADEHRGIRLKFEANDDQSIMDCSALALGREVSYKHEIPDFDPSRAHEFYFLKSRSWMYEREYRVLMVDKMTNEYGTNELKEIALGFRFNMEFLPVLKAWVKLGGHQDVSFVKAVPSSDCLHFEYVEIDSKQTGSTRTSIIAAPPVSR